MVEGRNKQQQIRHQLFDERNHFPQNMTEASDFFFFNWWNLRFATQSKQLPDPPVEEAVPLGRRRSALFILDSSVADGTLLFLQTLQSTANWALTRWFSFPLHTVRLTVAPSLWIFAGSTWWGTRAPPCLSTTRCRHPTPTLSSFTRGFLQKRSSLFFTTWR